MKKNNNEYSVINETSKSKKLIVAKFIEKKSKYDSVNLQLFAMAMNLASEYYTKKEFTSEMLACYDAKIFIKISEVQNFNKVSYNLEFINEKFLPNKIEDQITSVFNNFLVSKEIEQATFNQILDEYKLIIDSYLESRQNSIKLEVIESISEDPYQIKITEIKEYLKVVKINDLQPIINQIKNANGYLFSSNYEKFDLPIDLNDGEIDIKINEFKNTENIVINKSLKQAYISIPLKINVPSSSHMIIVNSILGGDVSSKLFKIIREQMNYSYNIRSSVQAKNLITINGGVNVDNIDKIFKQINLIIEKLQAGYFDDEFISSKINYISELKMHSDSFGLQNNIVNNNYVNGEELEFDNIIEKIKNIDKDEILECFKTIEVLTYGVLK